MNREIFFDEIRKSIFGGKLNQNQVDQVTEILDEWDRRKLPDLRWLAYMFATNLGECGPQLKPVREGFKTSDLEARMYVNRRGYKYAKPVNGQVYYGRGRVQLTWEYNYDRASQELHVDFITNPDLALDPRYATEIMFTGMIEGWFTGKKLADYFNWKITDWVKARKIINALDRAAEIGTYGRKFYTALVKAKEVGNESESA